MYQNTDKDLHQATQHGESQKPPPAFLHEDLPPAVLAHAQRLNDQDSEVRRTAVEKLGEMPMLTKEVIPAVAAMLDDQDFEVRRAALKTLGRDHSLPKEVVQAVAGRLEDQTSGVRQSAVETLGTQQNLPGEILEAVGALLQDQSSMIRYSVLQTLRGGHYLSGETLQAVALLLDDQSSIFRSTVLETLGDQRSELPDTILQAIEARLEDEDPQVQQRAMRALQMKPYTTTEVGLDKLSLWVRDRLGGEWDNEVGTDPESRQNEISLDISPMVSYLHSEGIYDGNEEKVLKSLQDVIAVTGDYQDAFCCTASQYVEWQWGPVGLEILQKLSSRLSNLLSFDRMLPWMSRGPGEDNLFRYHVSGQSSQDVANTLRLLIWISGAIRDLEDKEVLYSPAILYHKDSSHRFTIEWRVSELRRPEGTPNQVGTCWNRSFRHFNVATSFPIPPRPAGFVGLEAPLRLVSDLAQIEYMLPYLDAFVLKGQRTALIPLKYNKDASQKVTAVQWHLIESPNDHLSMDTVDGFNPSSLGCFGPHADYNPVLKSEDIRHFVGLYEEASLHVGVGDYSSNGVGSVVDGTDGVTRPFRWLLGWQRLVTLSFSISIPGGGIGAATTFKPVRKVIRTWDVPRDLKWLVDSACKNLTLLYDISTKTAWLVPEICAILHLLQVSIGGPMKPSDSARRFPSSSEIHLDLTSRQQHCVRFAEALSERYQTRLKGFIQTFRLLKEDIIFKSEGQRRRLSNFFRQGNQLTGVDFGHLADLPELITPLNVQVDDGTGGPWVQMLEANWNEAVECTKRGTNSGNATGLKVVCLLCDNLGSSPPIQPIQNQTRCLSWDAIPEGCDYMVTTVQCLQVLTKSVPGDKGKISPRHWWTKGNIAPFDFHACGRGGTWCKRLQWMLSQEPSGNRREWADAFVREQGKGAFCAIIFGSREPPATGGKECCRIP